MLGLELIKSYINDEMKEYQYLVDGSCHVKSLDYIVSGDSIWVHYVCKESYREGFHIDLLEIMGYIFKQTQKTGN